MNLHGTLRSWLADRRDQRLSDMGALHAYSHYSYVWRQLCEYIGLCHTVATVTGPTAVTPKLIGVGIDGSNPVLLVEMLPGQRVQDFRNETDRMVESLGCRFLRFTPRGDMELELELLDSDPLDVAVTLDDDSTAGHLVAKHPVLLAQTETGAPLWLNWNAAPHTVVQGATRSGKSVWCYSLIGQLVRCDDVLIAGSDPSGLLLGRPFTGSRHREWQAVGTQDVHAHLEVLRRIVAEMDRRIAELPDRQDSLAPSLDNPLLLVVLEEFAGLLRLASTLTTPRGEAKLVTDQLRALFGRLVSEGHKVAIRLLVVTQRADATIIGGFERGQLGLRLSFRVTDPEALQMLHPEGRDWFADHAQAPAGVALLETPTDLVTRVRGPRLSGDDLTDYARYWDQVQAVTACRRPHAA